MKKKEIEELNIANTDELNIVHHFTVKPRWKLVTTISTWGGEHFLGMRMFFENESDEWCPTKKGFTIKLDHIDNVAEALEYAADGIEWESE